MRDLGELDRFRCVESERKMAALMGGRYNPLDRPWGGFFFVPSPIDKFPIKAIVSRWRGQFDDGDPPFDHVSASRPNRCPNWPEMEYLKRLFFKPDEVAMQLHVAESEHISLHPYCLHIWRPCLVEIPMPPSWMVA